MPKTKRIQVFEHGKLSVGHSYGEKPVKFLEKHYNALVKLNELHKNQYFQIGYKSITFRHYVGVIQVEGLSVEVLPKADKSSGNNGIWQDTLVQMLKATRKLKVNKVGNAHVNKQSIHLLAIYFEWYLNELQLLIRQGLLRQYYRKQSNLKALKGKLLFSKHISHNIIHKERFYAEHQAYDHDHAVHQILRQALSIVERLSKSSYLYSQCKTIGLDFPEVKTIHANEATFDKIILNRKTKPYETALSIARVIILNYAPNITRGSEEMLALLFDMNSLWEEYILIKLKEAYRQTNYNVLGQRSEKFWNNVTIRPDIVVKDGDNTVCIIDTKWKHIWNSKPSTNDLRQMYVYNEYWKSTNAILLYPTNEAREQLVKQFHGQTHWCGLAWLNVLKGGKLNVNIGEDLKFIIESITKKAQIEEMPI